MMIIKTDTEVMGKCVLIYCFYTTLAFFILSITGCHENKAATATPAGDTTLAQKETNAKTMAVIKDAAGLLQDGDLVMRSDNDVESLLLQNFSDSDRTYSHSGIAFKEESGFVIYHAMTGTENPSGLFRKDPFDSFVSPERKTGFGIFRYNLSEKEKEKFHAAMKENNSKKIPFDISFNLKTDDSLYCSEMICKALKASTGGRIIIPTTTLSNFRTKTLPSKYNNTFFKKIEYVSLDNLYLNPFCKEIIRVKY